MPDDEEQEWTDWPENDCTREHPKGECKVKSNSFPKPKPSKARTGKQPFPDVTWDKPRTYSTFEVKVEFVSSDPYVCCCCEYRQRVKGVITHNGTPVKHELPGGDLSPDHFLEDGIIDHFGMGKHLTYGHRDGTSDPTDDYYDTTPDRKHGCTYMGRDAVNVPAQPGWKVDVEFEGLIIDVCRKRVITRKYWKVQFETK